VQDAVGQHAGKGQVFLLAARASRRRSRATATSSTPAQTAKARISTPTAKAKSDETRARAVCSSAPTASRLKVASVTTWLPSGRRCVRVITKTGWRTPPISSEPCDISVSLSPGGVSAGVMPGGWGGRGASRRPPAWRWKRVTPSRETEIDCTSLRTEKALSTMVEN